jgi:hypothetical protein
MKRRLGVLAAGFVGAATLVIPAGTAHAANGTCSQIRSSFDQARAALERAELPERQERIVFDALRRAENSALDANNCRSK